MVISLLLRVTLCMLFLFNRANPVASAANFDSNVNVAGCTNIVNHRILSAHSVGSVDRFDLPALFRRDIHGTKTRHL